MSRETTIQGSVRRAGNPLEGAYLTLKGASGEFVGEIRTDGSGRFRFYAKPGEWTLKCLTPAGQQTRQLTLKPGDEQEVEFEI